MRARNWLKGMRRGGKWRSDQDRREGARAFERGRGIFRRCPIRCHFRPRQLWSSPFKRGGRCFLRRSSAPETSRPRREMCLTSRHRPMPPPSPTPLNERFEDWWWFLLRSWKKSKKMWDKIVYIWNENLIG